MNRSDRQLIVLFIVGALAAACQDGGGKADAGPDAGPACHDGTVWTPGTSAFRDATADWGLIGVIGVRLSITDVDGDGWADVFVRNGGGPDDFSAGGERNRFVLRNTRTGTFEDFTESSGLLAGRVDTNPETGRPGQTFTTGDVDNDGDLDVYVGNSRTDHGDSSTETSELMLNNGDGTFELGPHDSDARFRDKPSNPAGVAFVDFDRDGRLDLWVSHNEMPGLIPMQDRLLKGDGAGGFDEVTIDRGLVTFGWANLNHMNEALAHSWAWSAAACDLNDDGLPELLASSYGRGPNHLWRAYDDEDEGQVMFENASIASGYAFDDDQDWTTNWSAQCYCEDNPDAEDCDTCPPPESYDVCESLASAFGENYRWNHEYGREPFSLGGNSGTTVCADIDNDGFLDLITHEIVHSDVGPSSDPSQILRNIGDEDVLFERPGNESTGLLRTDASAYWDHGDMTGAVFDFDNDGWPDIYIGASDYPTNKGLLYHQSQPLEFELLEVEDYFEHFRAHGVAVADFDHDGYLDVMVGHSLMRCEGYSNSFECEETPQVRLFENLMGDNSNWLQLRLEGGAGANRAAIGARVEVTADGVTQTQEVDGGHGHFGMQRDLVLHFGSGAACEVDVTVYWPDAERSTETFTLHANQRYHLVQGAEPTPDF
ncbi:MAG: CRTAC1 family protein [Deltaproteobacteria bacterium]|nr:CRTAC1 family protein [Deltaproteobacteria bacterium]